MNTKELVFQTMADDWYEGLPLGNGSLGAMMLGTADQELIQLNQESVWSCGERKRINKSAKEALPRVRELIFQGQLAKAEEVIATEMLSDPLSLGHYEPLADVKLLFNKRIPHFSERPAEKLPEDRAILRKLDMKTGLYLCEFKKMIGAEKTSNLGANDFRNNERKHEELDVRSKNAHDTLPEEIINKREAFISYPDQVMAVGVSFSERSGLRLELSRGNAFEELKTGEDWILLSGQGGGNAPRFVCMAKVETDGLLKTHGFCLDIEEASRVVIYIAGRTSYYGEEPETWCKEKLAAASKKGYEALKQAHIEDVRGLFDRVELKLSPASEKEASEETDTCQADETAASDRALAETFFHFARYLMIAGSREGGLPLNLQGIWNPKMDPNWGSRYTTNINLQMNYWMAECANLSECAEPLYRYIQEMIPNGQEVAREMYGCRGAAAHHNSDIFHDCATQDRYLPASLWPMGLGWLGTHLVEHYRYTCDENFRAEYLPVLREIALFFADFLVEGPTGELVTNPSTSPENTYLLPNGEKSTVCYGPAMDMQIIRELWQGYLELCEAGKEAGDELSEKICEMLPCLGKNKIGSRGQLLEWQEEYDEWEKGHRHISHLFGLYPGSEISEEEPEVFKASKIALEERLAHGGGGTGWSRSWIVNFRARLMDGEGAYQELMTLLHEQLAPNLFDLHPMLGQGPQGKGIFQIDGNFGGAAGILEMLVQSQNGVIRLLPALPDAWKNGEVKGLRLRGGLELSMCWKNRKVESVNFRRISGKKAQVTVEMNGERSRIEL